MFGDLPPSSSVTRLSARPALEPISRPTAVEPVNAILSTSGVVDERGAGLAVAGEDVEHARREADLERQLAEPQGAQRRLLGGLQHDRAAGGQRRPELPGGHQQREVPGDDLARTRRPVRGACRRACSGAADRQHAALDLRRPAGEVAQVADRARDVDVLGEPDRLAVVERLDLGELLRVLLERVGERVHQPLAAGRGHRPPRARGERLACGGDGAVDVLGAAVGDLGDLAAGGGVDASRTCGRRRPRAARRRSAGGASGR